MEEIEAIEAACQVLGALVDQFEQLGMIVTAAFASQAFDAAMAEREVRFPLTHDSTSGGVCAMATD